MKHLKENDRIRIEVYLNQGFSLRKIAKLLGVAPSTISREINKSKKEIRANNFGIIVDRPLGTYHPIHKDICYSVNYGYVDDVISGDGGEQDAYILGVNKPIKEFVGKVIAIIHRFDDVEEKWVVASEGESFSKDEIMRQINFQERFFKIEIRM